MRSKLLESYKQTFNFEEPKSARRTGMEKKSSAKEMITRYFNGLETKTEKEESTPWKSAKKGHDIKQAMDDIK